MTAVRKSLSTKSSWFKRNITLPLGQRSSRNLDTNKQSTPILANAATAVSPKRKRKSSRNLSVSPINETIMTSMEKDHSKKVVANIQKSSHERLPMMSTAGAVPLWLLRLHSVYRYSSAAAFLCVIAALAVYGGTVYSQELWSQTYRTLQSLQRNERQLNTTNATLTSKMAEEAEKPAAGLVLPTPGRTIFLPLSSSSSRPNLPSSAIVPKTEIQPETKSPMGY